MLAPPIVLSIFSAGTLFLNAGITCAQNFPNKPIRIVTAQAGGGSDIQARLIAQGISGPFGQQVVVDNRPSGVIPGDIVAKAPPDGYTLLFYNNILWLGPLLQSTPYDAVRDFAPVTWVGSTPSVLVVNPSMAVSSVQELIALAKAKPGQLNYGSTGTGSSNHLTAELLKSMAGVNIVRVNYKGAGPALNAIIAGEVQLMFTTALTGASYVKSGKLRVLAVTSAAPSALTPGVPTVAASGLPGYESITIPSIFAPAKTPRPVINKLHEEVTRYLNRPEVKENFFNTGMEVVGGPPEQLAAKMKAEIVSIGKVIKDAGIRAE